MAGGIWAHNGTTGDQDPASTPANKDFLKPNFIDVLSSCRSCRRP